MTVFSKVIAYITETLYNDFLTSNTQSDISCLTKIIIIQHFVEHIVNSQSCGLSSSTNTTLSFEFACSSSHRIDLLLTIEVEISIGDPSHDLFVSTHVWTEHIGLWSNEAFLGKLHGIFPSDSLNFTLRILRRVKSYTSFGTAEWDVSDSQLEGHERGKCHGLLEGHVGGVSRTTFNWHVMMFVLSPITSESLYLSIVSSNRNLET